MQKHYFIESEHDSNDYFTISGYCNNKEFKFISCDNIFSKNEVNYGSLFLVKTFLENVIKPNSLCLDIGCGYGTIGVICAHFLPKTTWIMSDVNNTACELTNKNIKLNKIKNVTKVINTNLYEGIDKVDYIVTNPPIKVGKDTLNAFITNAKKALKPEGEIYLVIKKQHGKDGLQKLMESTFNNVQVLKKDKGYYILKSKNI